MIRWWDANELKCGLVWNEYVTLRWITLYLNHKDTAANWYQGWLINIIWRPPLKNIWRPSLKVIWRWPHKIIWRPPCNFKWRKTYIYVIYISQYVHSVFSSALCYCTAELLSSRGCPSYFSSLLTWDHAREKKLQTTSPILFSETACRRTKQTNILVPRVRI